MKGKCNMLEYFMLFQFLVILLIGFLMSFFQSSFTFLNNEQCLKLADALQPTNHIEVK